MVTFIQVAAGLLIVGILAICGLSILRWLLNQKIVWWIAIGATAWWLCSSYGLTALSWGLFAFGLVILFAFVKERLWD